MMDINAKIQGTSEDMVGMNLTKVHCKHIWECHNEVPYITNKYFIKFKNKINAKILEKY
jgi:hypothetical protein